MKTAIFKKAVTDLTTKKVVLTLITLSHPNWGSLYMVDNVTPITSNYQLYTPYGFSFTPPTTGQSGDPSTRLEIEDVDRILTSKFKDLFSDATISVSIILADNPNYVEMGPYIFSVVQEDASGSNLTLTLKNHTVLGNNLTGFNMDSTYFPGLFL
jgi:hypothetical protein